MRPASYLVTINGTVDPTWLRAQQMHAAQRKAFGFSTLAPSWSELSAADRVDWWVAADRERNPHSYSAPDTSGSPGYRYVEGW